MSKSLEEEVEFNKKYRRIYYINYPISESEELFWEDGEGKTHIISNMETSHIENCIKLVSKDLVSMKANRASQDFLKLMEDKLEHLKQVLRQRLKPYL